MTAPSRITQVRWLGLLDYETVWSRMQARVSQAPLTDEWWLLEHPAVYTLGQNGDRSHLLAPGEIPVVVSDRGGQVTYHGPGQLVLYPLVNLKRSGMGIKQYVRILEQAAIDLLADFDVLGERRVGAPGVYVAGRKIASLGLRVRRGYCYHGLSLNLDMDLEPFSRIDPCGFEGLEMTQLASLTGVDVDVAATGAMLSRILAQALNTELEWLEPP